MITIADWLSEVSGDGWKWYIKYLSGNDTLANGTHQAGPYLPKSVVFSLFPSLPGSKDLNPRIEFPARIDSASDIERTVTAIWYNNRILNQGTRNEARITNWGGAASPLLDPESTGSLCVLAFQQDPGYDSAFCRVWVCQDSSEEELLQERLRQSIEPGTWLFLCADGSGKSLLPHWESKECTPLPTDFPTVNWHSFPDSAELVDWSIQRRPMPGATPDHRLLKRRTCEFLAYQVLEERAVLPRVREGFHSVEAFVSYAGAVTNRRKSRSGRSLELQLARVFGEEALTYSYGEVSEANKRPDFLFPSAAAYQDSAFPSERLRMLGVKTTCKDRWRQVLNEADRIPEKHLLTLQEGVSVNQHAEMVAAGIRLVVPRELHSTYPASVRAGLTTLESFVRETKLRIER